jgi:hypothetical protein
MLSQRRARFPADWLLETPTISHPAASSLLVVAKPIPSELPTSIALDCAKAILLHFLLITDRP